MTLLKDIGDGKISIQEAKDKQENYYNYLKRYEKVTKTLIKK